MKQNEMDKTSNCRDKCASSPDMLACMRDCIGAAKGPVSPNLKAAAPLLFGDLLLPENRKSTALKSAAIVAVVFGGLYLFNHKKKTGNFF